jgi:hypothetical protein
MYYEEPGETIVRVNPIEIPFVLTDSSYDVNRLGDMGLKWNKIPTGTKVSIESALMSNCQHMSQVDAFRLLTSLSLLCYEWHNQRELILSSFRTALAKEKSFSPESQKLFVSWVHNMAEAGVKWTDLPEDVNLIIFQGIEKCSAAFGTKELAVLFHGY